MILLANRNFADGQLTFANRVKLTDPVDRVLAGDQLDHVAADFDLNPKDLRQAMQVVADIGGIRRSSRARLWLAENVTACNES